jgi:hypothetical protein
MIDARKTLLLFSALALAAATSGCALWHGRAGASPDVGIAITLDAAPSFPDAAVLGDAGPCSATQQFFQPGCVTEPGIRITPGCYQPCSGSGDTSCGPGRVCDQTNIDPCNCSPGLDCCSACGEDRWLCLPWHSTPFSCEGRDYCSCNGACTALIDLTQGCVCPCDEPFVCGGPPCDCDCGGAQYLGCAATGQCPVPQLRCEPGLHAQLVGGCPTCASR